MIILWLLVVLHTNTSTTYQHEMQCHLDENMLHAIDDLKMIEDWVDGSMVASRQTTRLLELFWNA